MDFDSYFRWSETIVVVFYIERLIGCLAIHMKSLPAPLESPVSIFVNFFRFHLRKVQVSVMDDTDLHDFRAYHFLGLPLHPDVAPVDLSFLITVHGLTTVGNLYRVAMFLDQSFLVQLTNH